MEESAHWFVNFITILDDYDREVNEKVLQNDADPCCVEYGGFENVVILVLNVDNLFQNVQEFLSRRGRVFISRMTPVKIVVRV